MNAYPINPAIKKVKTNEKAALAPEGNPLRKVEKFEKENYLELLGMGMTSARKRKEKGE